MLNECLIHLFDCTYLNMMCVCSTIYGSNQKDFWSFYMFFKVIFITLCIYILCLLCFSLFKHVLCWKTSVRIFGYSFWRLASSETQAASFGDSPVTRPNCEFIQKLFATHSRLTSREIPKNSFLKCFFRGKLVLNLSHPLLNLS